MVSYCCETSITFHAMQRSYNLDPKDLMLLWYVVHSESGLSFDERETVAEKGAFLV